MSDFRIFQTSASGQTNRGGFTDDLGVQFKITTDGVRTAQIKGFFFWAPSTGDFLHTNYSWRLYSTTNGTTGTLITGSTTNVAVDFTASSWNYQALASPITLTNGTTYVAVLHSSSTNASHYTGTDNYWSTGAGASGLTSGPITAPGSGTALNGAQNAYNEPSATAAFPTSTLHTNYWLDVLISYDTNAGSAAATASAKQPTVAIGAPAGAASATVTARSIVNAGKAAATAAALAPIVAIGAPAGSAAASISGRGPEVTGKAGATAAAYAPVVAVGADAGVASTTGAALNPTVQVPLTSAGLASAIASALAPTITDSDSAPIDLAAVAADAYAPTVAIGVTADIATAVVDTYAPDVLIPVNAEAGVAVVTTDALDPVGSDLSVNAGFARAFAFANTTAQPGAAHAIPATVHMAAHDPNLTAYADAAASTADAYAANGQVAVVANAGTAAATVAVPAATSIAASTGFPDSADAIAVVNRPDIRSSSNAATGKAAATAVARNPTPRIGVALSANAFVSMEALTPQVHISGGSSAESRVLRVGLTAERTYRIPHESREKKVERK